MTPRNSFELQIRFFWAVIAIMVFALIVAMSPANAQSTSKFSATLSAACTNATSACDATSNSQLKLGVGEYSMASVTVHGTFTGATINFEFSDDGGVTWYTSTCTRNDATVQENGETLPNSTNRSWDCGVAAAGMFRVRLNAISTGSLLVNASLSSIQIEPAPTVSITIPPTNFSVNNTSAAGSQATVSQAAAGAGVRNVATEICYTAGATTAPAAIAATQVNLRDGASGAGTVLMSWTVVISASTGQLAGPFCTPVNAIGSANTAMTLEFAAGVSNTIENVTLQGYTTSF